MFAKVLKNSLLLELLLWEIADSPKTLTSERLIT